MYYEVHGEGEPLVFIMGAGTTLEPMLAVIPMYIEQFECILFDNRGIGKTDAPTVVTGVVGQCVGIGAGQDDAIHTTEPARVVGQSVEIRSSYGDSNVGVQFTCVVHQDVGAGKTEADTVRRIVGTVVVDHAVVTGLVKDDAPAASIRGVVIAGVVCNSVRA